MSGGDDEPFVVSQATRRGGAPNQTETQLMSGMPDLERQTRSGPRSRGAQPRHILQRQNGLLGEAEPRDTRGQPQAGAPALPRSGQGFLTRQSAVEWGSPEAEPKCEFERRHRHTGSISRRRDAEIGGQGRCERLIISAEDI